jgi:hypothetical protein
MGALQDAQAWDEVDELQRSLGIVSPPFIFPWAPEYWLSEQNRHLNPLGHTEWARQILAGMKEGGMCSPETASAGINGDR